MAVRPLAAEEFDAFVDGLDYPVFVVTAYDGSEHAGCLVGFASQVSIDPPRLMVCLSQANHTLRVAMRAEFLAVHVLGADDHEIAAHFGAETGDEVDKFAGVRWHPGPGGVPMLDDLPRCLVGQVLERVPLGDHVGHLLAPVAEHIADDDSTGEALTFQDVDDLEPGHPA